MRLLGKVAIVTSAARGIGRAIAREGARVAIVDMREDEGNETVALIEAAGGEALFIGTDVSDCAQVAAMVDEVMDRWNPGWLSSYRRGWSIRSAPMVINL